MNQDKYVFSQVVEFLNRNKFNRLVQKYNGNHYIKYYSCYNQLVTLIFGQLSRSTSLRDVVIALQAQGSKCYHLGVGKHVSSSNLAKANEQRDCRIFKEFAYYMIEQAKQKFNNNTPTAVDIYAFNSTKIDLCLTLFDWAKFRKAKGGIKVHTLFDIATGIPTFVDITEAKVNDVNAIDEIPYLAGSFYIFDRGYNDFSRSFTIHKLGAIFIVRGKKNVKFKHISWKRRLQDNVLSDSIIRFAGYYQEKDYPEELRLIKYWDDENKRKFIFLTNNFDLTALEISELYKQRWQIELFFK